MTERKITRQEMELVIRAAKGESVHVSLDMDKVAAMATLALQALDMKPRPGMVTVPKNLLLPFVDMAATVEDIDVKDATINPHFRGMVALCREIRRMLTSLPEPRR